MSRQRKPPEDTAQTIEEIRRARQERHDVYRWAEISVWPAIRSDFLRWFDDRKPVIPERDSATQPDPKYLLLMKFYRETGGDYRGPLETET
jgi:hypothetical protein